MKRKPPTLNVVEPNTLAPAARALASYTLADRAASVLRLGGPETGYQTLTRAAVTSIAFHIGRERTEAWLRDLIAVVLETTFKPDNDEPPEAA